LEADLHVFGGEYQQERRQRPEAMSASLVVPKDPGQSFVDVLDQVFVFRPNYTTGRRRTVGSPHYVWLHPHRAGGGRAGAVASSRPEREQGLIAFFRSRGVYAIFLHGQLLTTRPYLS
jgi:hypothetical protein